MKLRQIAGIGLVVVLIGTITVAVMKRPKPAANSANQMTVTASIYPLYEAMREVGGTKVTVTNVTPAGAEPHDYEPTPQQLAAASRSKVFAYNGGTMEPWTDKFVQNYTGVAVKGSTGITLKQGFDEATNQPVAGTTDPHYWLDPVLMETVADNVSSAFAKADPANAGYYAARATAYKMKLAQLDDTIGRSLSHCVSNTFVTAHAAFGYFADRYGMTQLPIAGLSPDAEPSAAKLADLANTVKLHGVTTIFFERLSSPKLAQTLAEETGAKTAVLDPIEGVTVADQKAGKDYFSIQGENVGKLRIALTCR